MAVDFPFKPRYDFDDLQAVMAALRGEGGCPWDRAQTHRSIRADFIEETYEAVEAIDTDDSALLQEELGDVLFQVVFHARLEQEAGRFTLDDVIDGICKKLIVRHPHVFGGAPTGSGEQLMRSWDSIKRRTRGQRSVAEGMGDIPRALPALMRARKAQQKTARAGVPAPGVGEAAEMARAALGRAEAAGGNRAAGARAAGELLFAAVALACALEVEPEQALTEATDRFIGRFARAERETAADGQPPSAMPTDRRGELWAPQDAL